MRERYQESLDRIQRELLDMGMLCEQSIMKTYRLLLSEENRNQLVAEINAMEKEIDGKEQIVEGLCIQLLLRQQPVAADLRRISAALKMITDLERIGDQAIDIGEIIQTGSIEIPVTGVPMAEMAEFTMKMVSRSIEAYVNRDLEMAGMVIDSDDQLDDMFLKLRQILKKNETELSGDQMLDLLMIAKYYERIGDHATNIAEWAEFSLTGIHRSGKEVYDVFGLNEVKKP